MHIADLFRYSDTCRALLHRALRDAVAVQPDLLRRPFETTSPYDNIAKLVAHCVAAEERWVTHRIGGQEIAVPYEQRAADAVDGLFADADAVRARTWELVNGLGADGLARTVRVQIPLWQYDESLTVEQILFQIVNHENYHRGQIAMRLQQSGLEPPNFDYVFRRG